MERDTRTSPATRQVARGGTEGRDGGDQGEITESKADKDRRQALELALSQIERQFGKGAVMKLGSSGALEETAVVPTGALTIDLALGIGGIPRGRVTEIYGPESSGKTTLALHVIAEAQRRAATRRSSTPSTRSTPPTPRGSA